MSYRVVAADPLSTQRQQLWDLSYRITGSAIDAEGIARECSGNRGVRSAAVLAVDALKRRRLPNYLGRWLPSPVETGSAASQGCRPVGGCGPRYDLVESGTMAFLRALEELDPRERAVFVMVDACGLLVHEVAAALELTSVMVRSVLQSARRKMLGYDAAHEPPTATVQEQVGDVLRALVSPLQNFDTAAVEKVVAPDAQALFDSGGEFVAPAGTVAGAAAVAKLLTRFAEGAGPVSYSFRMLNGLPAALGQAKARPRWASHFVIRVEPRERLVREVQVIMATAKLAAVRFDTL
jgi:Sigma-70, region 4